MNRLYYGDNLSIMERMAKYSVDLIYLDPPFKSEQNYNLLYKTLTGKPVPEQAEAFCDTWEMDAEKERLARTMPVLMREHGIEDYYVEFWRLWIKALRQTQPYLLAYLIYMVQRLLHMRSILKPTGSIYLHCDPTASHYIKIMMDGIFGHNRFQNEVIWQRTATKGDARRRFGRVHDVLLYYGGGERPHFEPVYAAKDGAYLSRFNLNDNDGLGLYRLAPLDSPNLRPNLTYEYKGYDPPAKGWRVSRKVMETLDAEGRLAFPKHPDGRIARKHYLREQKGAKIGDVWTDIAPLQASSPERLGYPTQKPKALLDRVIRASSKEGDVVFDPFCGCGTTIYAAEESGRKWIGCDIAILAVRLVEHQLSERYGLVEGVNYEEHGIPNSVDSAKALWDHDPFQFEHWATEYVGGFPTKKTGDKGIDGRIYFEMKKDLGVMVLSVKGGNVRPTDVRDLKGVLSDESDAHLAGLITMRGPTKGMRDAASQAGTWEYRGVEYPKVQILTVKELVEDKKRFLTPSKIGVKNATDQENLPLVGV